MRELGPDAEALHAQAGLRARASGLKRLYALGPLSAAAAAAFGDGGRHFTTHDALSQALKDELHPGVRCLVKGSPVGEPVRAVQLPDVPRHPCRADGPVPVAVARPGDDPQACPVQGRPADPQGRSADPFLQGRYADHGRFADPAHHHPVGADVGRPAQPLRVAGAGGDAVLRRHRLV
ncbi:hypothetical protein G6F35_014745 [Rhizopus arrhizus]|nr:hypothetical protein G6F35_014745 [Rhizopus arrhizus]